MLLSEAISLIKSPLINSDIPVHWADLGAGEGLFSFALADLLCSGSTIYAIDKRAGQLKGKKTTKVEIVEIIADFEKDDLAVPLLDGIIAANALHFIADQQICLKRLAKLCRPDAHFIIVEYDTSSATQWVPYPLPFSTLKHMFEGIGRSSIQRLGQIKSKYNSSNIYGAIISV